MQSKTTEDGKYESLNIFPEKSEIQQILSLEHGAKQKIILSYLNGASCNCISEIVLASTS